jgi:hypothetical protein
MRDAEEECGIRGENRYLLYTEQIPKRKGIGLKFWSSLSHQFLSRGAQLVGMGVDSFKDIVAASASTAVVHGSSATGFSALILPVEGGASLSSFVVPSLLFEDLTITKRPDELPKPPISAPPAVQR